MSRPQGGRLPLRDVPFTAQVRETTPFVVVMLVGLVILVLVAPIVTALPQLVFGG